MAAAQQRSQCKPTWMSTSNDHMGTPSKYDDDPYQQNHVETRVGQRNVPISFGKKAALQYTRQQQIAAKDCSYNGAKDHEPRDADG